MYVEVSAQNLSISEVRLLYLQSVQSEDQAKNFHKILGKQDLNKDMRMLGYSGVSTCLLAKYAFLPTTKLTFFKDGKNLIEKSIVAAPNEVELRFLRLSIQINAPAILGYKEHIEQDKQFVIKKFNEKGALDQDLKKIIYDFMINNKLCASGELIK